MYDYVKQHKWARLRVGMVMSLTLAVILLAVLFAGSIEKIFVPRVVIYAMVDDVKGLREGAPVWFSGVEIGSVRAIEFMEKQKVRVKMSIVSDAVRYLKKDSGANILTLGLLGDKYVEITPGSGDAEGLRAGDGIAGHTQTELQDVVQTSQASIEKIADFVGTLEEILVRVEKGQGTISKFIQDPAVYDNLREAIAELDALIGKMHSGKGTVARLMNDEALYRDISASAQDIRIFAESLKEEEGSLTRLIQDPSLYDRFQEASESLSRFAGKLEASTGTVNRLIEDEQLYENMNSASEKLNSLLDRVENGEGVVGSLVRDDELSRELKSTLKELNTLIKDIRENPKHYFKFSLF
ncbi:MAG: MCE family protein [Nitrospiraceae bacterium]|nr:MAG: MCE family protein [Nitrospiraceae bacterium]